MWQPIETAPKDGTRILVALKFSGTHPYFVGRTRIAKWKSGRWHESAGQYWPNDDAFCGWQPLPEAPEMQFAVGQQARTEEP